MRYHLTKVILGSIPYYIMMSAAFLILPSSARLGLVVGAIAAIASRIIVDVIESLYEIFNVENRGLNNKAPVHGFLGDENE